MALNLLTYFPYPEPRAIQARVLEELGRNWASYDVFVIQAPTAFGKSAVLKTLMGALHSVSGITPTNQLVEQFREEFPETATLSRMDSYRCEEYRQPCSVTRGRNRQFCKSSKDVNGNTIQGCPCAKDLATAKYRNGPGIYNYHMYLAQKLVRKSLVVDEAHNLIPFIRERLAVTIWQHDVKYPGNMFTQAQMQAWYRSLSPTMKRKKKLAMLGDAVDARKPEYVATRTKDWFNGKGTVRGEPEERDCIKLMPIDIRGAPPFFWGSEVEKLVLLSATISRKDIETLGLNRRKVLYISCESPIPADSRPIVSQGMGAVNHSNLLESTVLMGEYIRDTLAPTHMREKGMIHATYAQAEILRGILGTDSRYLFHGRENKADVYAKFRASRPEEGKVLVASGMYEGVDLNGDAGRWQVVAKTPWPNLGSPMVKHLADADSEWYLWEALKLTMQACGRICRDPKDFGVTYMLDGSFERLIREGSEKGLVPNWYMDAIDSGGGL
jgi:Rad3-related DNA helicase